MYKLVFKRALEAQGRPVTTSPYSRYYFVTSEALPWKRVADAYAKALYERGKISKSESVRLAFEEAGPYALYVLYAIYKDLLTDSFYLIVRGRAACT